jgi:hypothetical protein
MQTDKALLYTCGLGEYNLCWVGNAAGNRALSIVDEPLGQRDIFGIIGYLSAIIAAVVTPALLTYAGLKALKKGSS